MDYPIFYAAGLVMGVGLMGLVWWVVSDCQRCNQIDAEDKLKKAEGQRHSLESSNDWLKKDACRLRKELGQTRIECTRLIDENLALKMAQVPARLPQHTDYSISA